MASIRPSPGRKGDIAFRRLSRRTVPPVLLFFAAAAAVLALTWPWVLHWRGEFFAHWDPPFHAWKLEFMARRILAGDVFLSSGDSNVFHPYSGTLYYEALQYPPALFAAVLFGLTPMPSELVYHVTLLVFWALSAPCMYFLLRTLACSRPAATFGSMAFCILPWRVSFAAEFQMQLVFAMPLVFAFLVRFLRDGRAADAVLCALSWWLLAVSELYEAAFVAMALPFVAAAFAGRDPRMLLGKRFWTGAAAGTAAAAGSLFLLLRPYLVLRAEGNVVRPLSEISAHAVQPLSYLVPYGRFSFWDVPAWEDEFSVYPTLAVAALSAAGAVLFARRVFAGGRRGTGLRRTLLAATLSAEVLVAAASVAVACGCRCMRLLSVSLVAAAAAGFVPMALPLPGESPRTAFLRGSAVAAAFCFLLSLGPEIYGFRSCEETAANPVYLFCHGRLLPFLSGFRVVSRFGTIVLFFLLCLSSAALDRLLLPRLRRSSARVAAVAVALAAVAVESLPGRGPAPPFRPVEPMRDAPSVAGLLAELPERTVVEFPFGFEWRWSDAMRKLSLVKGDWPCAFAWGGFCPPWQARLEETWSQRAFRKMHGELSKLYPDALLLADLHPAKEEPASGDPDRAAFRPGQWRGKRTKPDFLPALSSIATPRTGDGRFVWMELKPPVPGRIREKVFRTDLLRRRPVCEAAVRTSPGASVEARFNGVSAAVSTADASGVASFRFAPALHAPPERTKPNSVTFSAGAVPCTIISFALVPETAPVSGGNR